MHNPRIGFRPRVTAQRAYGRIARGFLVTLGLSGCLVSACFAQTAATYDAGTRYLTLPSVQALGSIYNSVVIRLDSIAVITLGSTTPPAGAAASVAAYDSATRYLTLPSLLAAGAAYYGLVARLDGFAVISIAPPEPAQPPSVNYYNY
jgi:hypothetical protein